MNTPTLTGHGNRSHLDTSSATIETFVSDVANVLFYEDLATWCSSVTASAV